MKIINKLSLTVILLTVTLSTLWSQQANREQQLVKIVDFITADSLLGRAAGSKGELIVANYVYDYLKESGVELLSPRDGDDFYMALEDTIHSRNIIGVIPGYDPQLKDEYIVIGAHIDHLGYNKLDYNGNEKIQIYPGADDNASGVATLLELAKEISLNKFMFRRSVIIAAFGAEEVGMAGSWYFLNRAFGKVDDIVMMINLDMVGRSSGENKIQTFTAMNNPDLTKILDNVTDSSLFVKPVGASSDYFPSDHRTFYEKDIPVVLFTTGTHRDYHTPRDTKEKLDYEQMSHLVEYVYSLAEVVANRDERVRKSEVIVERNNELNDGELIYTQKDVDKRATFLHKDELEFLNTWVYPYIKYPDSAISKGIEGDVIVEFIVDRDGKVKSVNIAHGVEDDIDAEVIKVVSASPKWKAAQVKGKNVSVRISLPVEFRLTKNSKLKLKR